MNWYVAYVVVGLITALWALRDIRKTRKHLAECDGHRESASFLKKLDDNPVLLPILVFVTIFFWWYILATYAWLYFGGDDDDDNDPQNRVPVQYR